MARATLLRVAEEHRTVYEESVAGRGNGPRGEAASINLSTMRDHSPAVYLLAGPSVPAKAAYARVLSDHGVVEVRPETAAQTAATLVEHVQTGRDAFLDHDLFPEDERDRYRALVEEHGGQWCLINFGVDHSPLATRLRTLEA